MRDVKVIGIDPGSRVTGFGIVEVCGNQYQVLDYGCIRPPVALPLSERRQLIFEGISHLIATYQPQALAIESQFVKKDIQTANMQTAMKLSMVRGVAILAATQAKIPPHEYAPSRVKRAVSGNGNASKSLVQIRTQQQLGLAQLPPEDAADALAVAICHLHASEGITTAKRV